MDEATQGQLKKVRSWAATSDVDAGRNRDEARALLSQLTTALDTAGDDLPSETRAAADRYQLLAGAALGADPDQDDCRRSIELSRTGPALLNGS